MQWRRVKQTSGKWQVDWNGESGVVWSGELRHGVVYSDS